MPCPIEALIGFQGGRFRRLLCILDRQMRRGHQKRLQTIFPQPPGWWISNSFNFFYYDVISEPLTKEYSPLGASKSRGGERRHIRTFYKEPELRTRILQERTLLQTSEDPWNRKWLTNLCAFVWIKTSWNSVVKRRVEDWITQSYMVGERCWNTCSIWVSNHARHTLNTDVGSEASTLYKLEHLVGLWSTKLTIFITVLQPL